MKHYNWNLEKNENLKKERGISFERVTWWIENGGLMDIIEHPNKKRYPHQKVYAVNVDGYVHWVPFGVPFVESEEEIFLKTVIPSRKATHQYFGGQK